MGNFIHTQNSFADGEVSPEFFARENIGGLSKLENMDVLSSGALARRKGLEYVAKLSSTARLIPFSMNDNDNYLLVLRDKKLDVLRDGIRVSAMIAPWNEDDLDKLQYAQRVGTMIFVHPDYKPQIMEKDGSLFKLIPFGFSYSSNGIINIPFVKFDDTASMKISITTNSGGSNYATFTADSDFWNEDSIFSALLVQGRQWNVVQYNNPRSVVAATNGGYTLPSAPVSDWAEPVFSDRRGWPRSISFHQDRLVFGGTRDWPGGVWMSKVGFHNNFNIGTGLDDEAIFITLLSEQRQQICTVVSSDNLQILTSTGEWMISSKPLTPSSISIKQHTSIGSVASRYLTPQKIEGSTVFLAGNEKDIRELTLDDLGESYSATDLCALSKHLMDSPVDLAYNDRTNQLFVVMKSGGMAVLNKNSALGISAWGTYSTQGVFKSVAVMNGETFVTVERADGIFIEKFSDDSMTDGAMNYGFSFHAAGLPLLSGKHAPEKIRLRKLSARIMNTKSLFMNGLCVAMPNEIYAADHPGYSGDVSVNLLGDAGDAARPLWKITSDDPLPATILSVTMNGRYSI
jgi:hypothetical protein